MHVMLNHLALVPRGLGCKLYVSADRPEVSDNLQPQRITVPVFFCYPTNLFGCGTLRLAYHVHLVANGRDLAPSRDQLIHEIRDFIRGHLRSSHTG